jgi:DnaJ-class molecular chaperone
MRKRKCKACKGRGIREIPVPCGYFPEKCKICDGTGKVKGDEDAAFDPANFSEEQKERIRKAKALL